MNIIKKKLIIILFSIFIISCSNKKPQKIIINSEEVESKAEIKLDTIKIKVDSTSLNVYSISTVNVEKEEYIGYNNKLHSLDIFSFKTKTKIRTIKLFKEGPLGINDLSGIQYLDDNNLIILTEYSIKILDLYNGNYTENIIINDSEINEFFKEHYIYVSNITQLKYNSVEKKLYFTLLNPNLSISTSKGDYYEQVLLGFYSFPNKQYGVLKDITYPKEYVENYYGLNETVFLNFTENEIYYTLSGLPKIYSSNKIIQFNNIDLNNIKFDNLNWDDVQSEDKKIRHYIMNPNFYSQIQLNNYKLFFYRSAMPEHAIKINDLSNKAKNVMLLDENFMFISNLELKGPLDIDKVFTVNNVVYIPTVIEENYMYFITLRINRNE